MAARRPFDARWALRFSFFFFFFSQTFIPPKALPLFRRSPNVPLALNSTTQVPPSRCRGSGVHSRNEGLAGHRAVRERQATWQPSRVPRFSRTLFPMACVQGSVLVVQKSPEKPVCSVAGSAVQLSSCALHGPCKCNPRWRSVGVAADFCRMAAELLQTSLFAGFLESPQCSTRRWKYALQTFPRVSILVAAGGNTTKETFFFLLCLRFFFFFLSRCCHCRRCIIYDFRGPDKPKKSEVDKGHSRCRAFGNVDRWSLLGHLGLRPEQAFTQRHAVMVLWNGLP